MAFLDNLPILSLILAWPLVGALAVMFAIKGDEAVRRFSLFWSLVPLVASSLLWWDYARRHGHQGLAYEEYHPWIPSVGQALMACLLYTSRCV